MLDVHSPHEAVHTWKDFFIHIITIVIGLVIAVGLEQIVEHFHHQHQLREVRSQLAEERDLNRRIIDRNAELDALVTVELAADNLALERHAAGDKTPLSGKLHYAWFSIAPQIGAWQAAGQSAAVSLMSEKELLVFSYRYNVIGYYLDSSKDFNATMEQAAAIARDTPNGDLNPEDTRDLIRLTHQAQGQLALEDKLLAFVRDYGLHDELDYSFLDRPAPRLY